MRCFCATARQVARRLTRLYEAELAAAGMNPAQFELLANVAGRPGLSQTELAARMDVDQTTLSRNVKLLVGRGWLAAQPSQDDARRTLYGLSAEGRVALAAAMPLWERATERVSAALGNEVGGVWMGLEMLGAAV